MRSFGPFLIILCHHSTLTSPLLHSHMTEMSVTSGAGSPLAVRDVSALPSPGIGALIGSVQQRPATMLATGPLTGICDETVPGDSCDVPSPTKKARTGDQVTVNDCKQTTKDAETEASTDGVEVQVDAAEQRRKKRIQLARDAPWRDIPHWGDRTDTPLLTLPAHILDMCFGFREDVELRDYVALSGVSKFFRHNLDDAFFKVC